MQESRQQGWSARASEGYRDLESRLQQPLGGLQEKHSDAPELTHEREGGAGPRSGALALGRMESGRPQLNVTSYMGQSVMETTHGT